LFIFQEYDIDIFYPTRAGVYLYPTRAGVYLYPTRAEVYLYPDQDNALGHGSPQIACQPK
jgi:hypothetical protein